MESEHRTVVESNGPMFVKTTVPYSPEELLNAKSNLELLREQQRARVNESSSELLELLQLSLRGFDHLCSIRLDGALTSAQRGSIWDGKGAWHPLWMRVSYVFSLIITAIVQSEASVRKLDVYRSTPRCCIPSSHITTHASALSPEQLSRLGKSLESFELSMSGEIQNELDIAESIEDSESECKAIPEERSSCEDPREVLAQSTPGITSLLKSAPALRDLNLSFRTTQAKGELDNYERIIESLAYETHSPALETCALSGFMAKGEPIVLFLQKHPGLRSFTLHQYTLTTGSWTPIFSRIEQLPRLENLSLSNLYGKYNPDLNHAGKAAGLNLKKEAQEEEGIERKTMR